eukprot:2782512-Prymnesium_polylepis.2
MQRRVASISMDESEGCPHKHKRGAAHLIGAPQAPGQPWVKDVQNKADRQTPSPEDQSSTLLVRHCVQPRPQQENCHIRIHAGHLDDTIVAKIACGEPDGHQNEAAKKQDCWHI